MDRQTVKEKQDKKPLNLYKLLTFLFAAILVVVLGIIARGWYIENRAGKQYEDLAEQVNKLKKPSDNPDFQPIFRETESAGDEKSGEGAPGESGQDENTFSLAGVEVPRKNLDWNVIRQRNPDIYAWIYIPGTKIDYPILQHPTDDSYYLKYNMSGTRGYPGCIYTELLNSKEFTDYNTVVYGHNMRNDSMFATLHYFEDGDFFQVSPYVYIYTEDKVLVYEIFAAFTGGDEHILYTYDFSSRDGREAYLGLVMKYGSAAGGHFRDMEVGGDSHILTLSTCVKGKSRERFLVHAALLNEDELARE